MSFNHYAKIKRILEGSSSGWYVVRIDESTKAKNFKGETKSFNHYYRIYNADGNQIPYCKFQQLDLFARIMDIDVDLIEVTIADVTR